VRLFSSRGARLEVGAHAVDIGAPERLSWAMRLRIASTSSRDLWGISSCASSSRARPPLLALVDLFTLAQQHRRSSRVDATTLRSSPGSSLQIEERSVALEICPCGPGPPCRSLASRASAGQMPFSLIVMISRSAGTPRSYERRRLLEPPRETLELAPPASAVRLRARR